MTDMQKWVFVDDKSEEAKSFAAQMSNDKDGFCVRPIDPTTARAEILGGKLTPSGILMDVDFSAIPGELGTGLGIAQDIRAKQKSQDIGEFAIVRFAGAVPVSKSIGGDPTSDDLFDLKIDKREVGQDVAGVQKRLRGVCEVYTILGSDADLDSPEAISRILGLKPDLLDEWSHSGLHRRLADNRAQSVHVAAGTFVRSFLLPAGLLIDETLLSVRLGVDISKSGAAWNQLRADHLASFGYSGAASDSFPRWWARGLDDWWRDRTRDETSLASQAIADRHRLLVEATQIPDLAPLEMAPTSPGTRPWRLCSLYLEDFPAILMPVDPEFAVRMSPRADSPPWVDPAYAELGEALRRKDDRRLNAEDIEALGRRFRRSNNELGKGTTRA